MVAASTSTVLLGTAPDDAVHQEPPLIDIAGRSRREVEPAVDMGRERTAEEKDRPDLNLEVVEEPAQSPRTKKNDDTGRLPANLGAVLALSVARRLEFAYQIRVTAAALDRGRNSVSPSLNY